MEPPRNTVIMLRLRELAQLFNSMDPSPFIDRDLDADAEEYIMSWARELPAGPDLELVIQLSTPAPAERVAGVEDSVRRYFATRAAIKGLEFGQLMRRGRLSLIVGSVFLPGKADSILIIDSDAVLALAVPVKRFERVPRPDAQIG